MLVLSRQHNEALVIGDDLLIIVDRIHADFAEFRLVRGPVNMPGEHKLQEFHLREGEEFQIAEDVGFTLVQMREEKIRVGVSSPADMAVHRKELYDAIHRDERRRGDDSGGLLGAPVPRTPKPSVDSVSAKKQPPIEDEN